MSFFLPLTPLATLIVNLFLPSYFPVLIRRTPKTTATKIKGSDNPKNTFVSSFFICYFFSL